MPYRAKNESVAIGGTTVDYVVFGSGTQPLVLIPGVGDGLQTVKGMAVPLSLSNREFAKDFRVYVFSRGNALAEDCSTRDMARELQQAMTALGIRKAYVVGVSQGGMIAQHLACEYPALVAKLVLVVTLARPNETMEAVVKGWIRLAEAGDYKGILIDSAEKIYSEKRLRWYRLLYPALGLMGKPKDMRRFIIQAEACMRHDAYDALDAIACPTLIIGGDNDKIVGVDAAAELNARIPGSRLLLYEGLGHGTYEEAKDFNRQIKAFLLEKA